MNQSSFELDEPSLQAAQLSQAGDWRGAELAYRQALEKEPGNAGLWLELAQSQQAQHDQAGAEASLRRAVTLCPDFARAHNKLGVLLASRREVAQAIRHFQQAIDAWPDYAQAHNNLANARKESGQLEYALASYERALVIQPDFPLARANLGEALRQLGRLEEATTHLEAVVRAHPELTEGHNNLGAVLAQQKRHREAAEHFRQAIRQKPDWPDLHCNLGTSLSALRQRDDAIASFRRAMELKPGYLEAQRGLAQVLLDDGEREEALAVCQNILTQHPASADAHWQHGLILKELGRLDEALAACRRAVDLKPDSADAQNALGVILDSRGDFAAALATFERALALKPDEPAVHRNRSFLWLRSGDWENGWQEYEWRWRCPELPERRFPQALWDGKNQNGKTILLHAEQGLGDTIQFARYGRAARERCARVVLACQRALVPLLTGLGGIDQVVAQGDPIPRFDVHAPLLSLPRIFGTRLHNIPADVPYLRPRPDLARRWREELGLFRGFKVAIHWQGSKRYRDDWQRSMPLAHFGTLGRIAGVQLFSLQKGDGREQLANVDFPVVDLTDRLDGKEVGAFMDTAAVMCAVDLVVTSDTAIAHLAGALGVPTWVPLGPVSDWRWLLERQDSPWYPTMRLFRQAKGGGWQPVFERMSMELRSLVERTAKASGAQVASPTLLKTSDAQFPSASAPQTSRAGLPSPPASRREGLTGGAHEPEKAATINPQKAAPASMQDLTKARDWMTLGKRHHQTGDLAAAERCYLEAVQAWPDLGQAWYLLGAVRDALGHSEEAAAAFREAILRQPGHPESHNHLGVVLARLGYLDDAVKEFVEALRLRPQDAEFRSNLGLAFIKLGKAQEAAAAYRDALQGRPGTIQARDQLGRALQTRESLNEILLSPEIAGGARRLKAQAHHDAGVALMHEGKLEQAIASFQRALAEMPESAEALNNMGFAHAQLGRREQAIRYYLDAIRYSPKLAEAHNNLAIAYRQQSRLPEAETAARRAIELNPATHQAHNNLGLILLEQNRLDQAIDVLRNALRLKIDFAPAHNNLGIAFWKQGRLEEAQHALMEALRYRPDFAEAHNNLSNVFRDEGQLDKAIWHLDEGLRLKPDYVDARFNRSLIWLGQGDLHRGWPEYEFRWQRTEGVNKAPAGPSWDGSPLAGRTILLHAEQGLGDTLQFVRYARLVKDRGGKVVLLCQKPLLPILQSAAGIDQFVAQGDSLPAYDLQAPLMSLPRILGTTIETIPATVPYLKARPELLDKWRRELSEVPGFKVGIAWQGSPRYRADWQRSIPLARFESLAQVPGLRLISLQKGPGQEQLAGIGFPVWDLAERLDTNETGPFLDTAAVMQSLDLLITSDSAIVHLAGALAVPIWVALPFMPDWRWLLDRNDSPWYPTMRLFRQRVRGNWEEVFARIAEELRGLKAGS